MKQTILAAVALVALASCAKENTTTEPITDQVAATFTAASITRVADNAWESGDQIGISMTVSASDPLALADGSYENVAHTVKEEGDSGTFTPDNTTIYFPVDGSAVDFYAYYPLSTLDTDKNIAVNVATQSFSDIDIVAATATAKTKAAPTVTFTGTEAFEHQLSKLNLTLVAGAGISSLTGLKTTIKGQYTTAKFNIYTFAISGEGGLVDVENENEPINIATETAVDSDNKAKAYTSAILIPTEGTASSSIVFSLDGNNYIWDTKDLELKQGCEHNYEITITKTAIIVSGATISNWDNGDEDGKPGTGTAE